MNDKEQYKSEKNFYVYQETQVSYKIKSSTDSYFTRRTTIFSDQQCLVTSCTGNTESTT